MAHVPLASSFLSWTFDMTTPLIEKSKAAVLALYPGVTIIGALVTGEEEVVVEVEFRSPAGQPARRQSFLVENGVVVGSSG
jgi:hypothetical protein